MTSAVAFVDYTFGSSQGYIRFKTWQDALLAQSYYSQVCVYQRNGHDAIGELDPARSRRHYQNYIQGEYSFPDAISVYVLNEFEEGEYWESLKEMAEKPKRDDDRFEDCNEYAAEVSDNPDNQVDVHSIKKRKKLKSTHVIFAAFSDSESDGPNDEPAANPNEMEDNDTKESNSKKRKARHRKSKKVST